MTILSAFLRSAKVATEKHGTDAAKKYRGATTAANLGGGGPWLKYKFQGNTVIFKPAHNDTFFQMFNIVKEKHELWPLFIFSGIATTFLAVIVYWSFSKMEVQMSRTKLSTDWDKAKNYVGRKWNLLDKEGGWKAFGAELRTRDPNMDKVQADISAARHAAEGEKKKAGGHH